VTRYEPTQESAEREALNRDDDSRDECQDDADGRAPIPLRRTPTYMELVKSSMGTSPPESDTAPPVSRDGTPLRSVGSRTRIGLPPVTVLPGQIRRRDSDGHPVQHGGADGYAAAGTDAARVLSRETVLMGAAPRPEPSGSRSQALVVSAMHLPGTAMERVLPAAGGRKARPSVPAAEVAVSHHTVPGGRAWPLVVLGQRFLPQAAAVRSLRHRLVEKGDPRVVLVTSAARKEGKTFCAANLALALAEIRRSRVLLLEANVYHPSLASLFGLRQVPCFLEQLEAHKRDFMAPWKVAQLSTHDLHLMAIDSRTERVRALEGAIFTNTMDSLRGRYDYIVIDGPSVNAGPDVALLEDAVDGIFFTARADQARARSLKYAIEQISPQDMLGVVLLDF
jgi:Mrp family chromosome partitioning ATPase